MPRTFVDTRYIRMSPGAFSGVPMSYGTYAMLVYWTGSNSDYQEIVGSHAGADPGVYVGISTANWNCSWNQGAGNSQSATAATANEWYFVAMSKATGTAAPRFHVYRYSTAVWTHENGGTTFANNAQNISNIDIGRYATGFEYWQGDIAAVGMYRTWVPSDNDIEAAGLPFNLGAWYAATLRADLSVIWLLDEDATTTNVIDLTGGGANQASQSATPPAIGTLSIPNFTYGAPIIGGDGAAAASSTANLGTASATVAANNLSVSTTIGTATITTTLAAPADAYSFFAATAALTANLAGTGHTPLVALATTLANLLGYTDTVSTTVAALTLSAANLATGTTPTAATLALVANALTGTDRTSTAATATLTASNPSGTRTSATATTSTLANPLAFTAATALQQATIVTVAAAALGHISATELAATATFTANGASLGATIAAANITTLALNLTYTAQPVLTAAAVSFAANGLALTPTSTLGNATATVIANGLAVADTTTAATTTVTASPLSDALTLVAANATTLASPLIQTRTAVAAQAAALVTAYNLTNQTAGTANLASAAALVTAYQITPLALISGLTTSVVFAASPLTSTDRAQPAATATTLASPLSTASRQTSTTVQINISTNNLIGLYTPQAAPALALVAAYNLANAAATAQKFRDWVDADVRHNLIAANVRHVALEAAVHE